MKSIFFILTLLSMSLYAQDKDQIYTDLLQDIQYEKIKADPALIRNLKQQINNIDIKRTKINHSTKGVISTTINGTVTEAAGSTALMGYNVNLYKYSDANQRFLFQETTSTVTGGVYTFTVTEIGIYSVSVGDYYDEDNYFSYVWNVNTNSQQLCSNCALDTITHGLNMVDNTPVNNIDFSLALGGSIEGNLSNVNTGLPVTTLTVQLINTDENADSYAVVADIDQVTGDYVIRGIPDGIYRAYLSSQSDVNEHIPQIYGGPQCNVCSVLVYDGIGSTLTIAGANNLINIDWTLEVGASISGFLVDQLDLQPHYYYGAIYVFNELNYLIDAIIVYGDEADPVDDGSYTVGGLLPGSYYVQGGDLGTKYYQRELFESIPCPYSGCDRGDGDPVVVGHQQQLAGINIQLNLGGKIEGFIKDAVTGAGLTTIDGDIQWYQIYDSAGNVAGGGRVYDTVSGAFNLARAVAPGNYYLRTGSMFSGDFNEPYIEELYNNIPCPGVSCDLTSAGLGTPITVVESATTSGISIELSQGNSFTGIITELGGVNPIADVHVLAYTATSPPKFATWATTDATGNFTIHGLPDGDYYLLTNNGSNLPFMGRFPAESAGWIDILYDGIACPGGSCDFSIGDIITLPIATTQGTTGPDIELTLDQGATIAGRVTDFNLNTPISNVFINVFDSIGTFIASQVTNSQGEYTTIGLPAGTYYLTTSSYEVIVDEIYGAGYCFESSCDPLSGTPIVLTNQQTATGYDFNLRPDFIFSNGVE